MYSGFVCCLRIVMMLFLLQTRECGRHRLSLAVRAVCALEDTLAVGAHADFRLQA